jgi:hypothetical protein
MRSLKNCNAFGKCANRRRVKDPSGTPLSPSPVTTTVRVFKAAILSAAVAFVLILWLQRFFATSRRGLQRRPESQPCLIKRRVLCQGRPRLACGLYRIVEREVACGAIAMKRRQQPLVRDEVQLQRRAVGCEGFTVATLRKEPVSRRFFLLSNLLRKGLAGPLHVVPVQREFQNVHPRAPDPKACAQVHPKSNKVVQLLLRPRATPNRLRHRPSLHQRIPCSFFAHCQRACASAVVDASWRLTSSLGLEMLWVLFVLVAYTSGYVFQFSLTEPVAPAFVQYSPTIFGSTPFGFRAGAVTLVWTAWKEGEWNASALAHTFFIDYMGHWRPPINAGAAIPSELGIGYCPLDHVHRGRISDLDKLLASGDCVSWATWDTDEDFIFNTTSIPDASLVVIVYSLSTPFSDDCLELSHLTVMLTNLALEGDRTELSSGQRGVPELFTAMLVLWSIALVLILANQWLRRHVRTSNHVWYMTVLFALRIFQLAWATTLWWLLRFRGSLTGDEVLLVTLGQVGDFWARLAFQIGATIVALDAPMITTSKPARTALVWMLLVGLVAMFASVTFADLTWWLWGAMLLWTDMFLQISLSLSLIWIFRLDALRDQAGKPSKFASKTKCCYGVFSWTTVAPLSYARLLLIADSLRASPLWYRGDFLPHYALVEVFHAGFAVWILLVVTARVARDDMRARAFAPLSMSASQIDDEDLERQGVQMDVFAASGSVAPLVAAEEDDSVALIEAPAAQEEQSEEQPRVNSTD